MEGDKDSESERSVFIHNIEDLDKFLVSQSSGSAITDKQAISEDEEYVKSARRAKLNYKTEMDQARLERFQENSTFRKELTSWAKDVVVIYMIVVGIITLTYKKWDFIDPEVMMTILGTTTLNVLGLMAIVLRGYFNESNKGNKRKKRKRR
jgi:Asp-tRNA(Asn)/Glu-tRNA(Gln) amidotransferase A subunit family amidase